MWRFSAMSVLGVCLVSSLGCARSGDPANPPAAEVKVEPLPADVDPDPRIAFQFDQGMRIGLTVVKDAAGTPVNKKLTYDDRGGTNDVVLRVDGKNLEFGSSNGSWVNKEVRFPRGAKSVWATKGIEVSQIVEIVPSKQPIKMRTDEFKRILDTCLMRYEIENKDSREHKVGLRIMMDTLIGFNDGVPFAVPTMQGMVTTFKDFKTPKEVPDFVQALEIPNLQNPGTVGHMTLKVGGNMEPPDRVSLTAWMPVVNKQNQRILPYDIPVQHMFNDSAVALYWDAERVMKPGDKRIIGFAYGLGSVAAGEGTGKLALTVNGLFFPGGTFTVTAYVNKPAPGQTLTLDLPPGLKRVEGLNTVTVPPPQVGAAEGRDTSILTWKVESSQRGKYQINVRSSTGVSQKQEVTIQGE